MYVKFYSQQELDNTLSGKTLIGEVDECFVRVEHTGQDVRVDADEVLSIASGVEIERLRCNFTATGLRFWWISEEQYEKEKARDEQMAHSS